MSAEKNGKLGEKTEKLNDDSEDMDFLEDDDDFEEFRADPVEDHGRGSIIVTNDPERNAEDWDDEDVDADFDEILCKEIGISATDATVNDLGIQFPSLSLGNNDDDYLMQPKSMSMGELDISSPRRENKENSPKKNFSPTKRRSASYAQKDAPKRPSSASNRKNK